VHVLEDLKKQFAQKSHFPELANKHGNSQTINFSKEDVFRDLPHLSSLEVLKGQV